MALTELCRAVNTFLWKTGTEYYEAFTGFALMGCALWMAAVGKAIFIPLHLFTLLAPPVAWGLWFGFVGAIAVYAAVRGNPPLRYFAAWAMTLTFAYCAAQFIVVDRSRMSLGFPLFAALLVFNTWLVVRRSNDLRRYHRIKGNLNCTTLSPN